MVLLTNLSLQKRIGLLILSGLVITLGLFSWLGVQSVNDSVRKTLDERLILTRTIASHLDEHLTYTLSQLQDMAGILGGIPPAEEFSSAATSLRERLTESGVTATDILLVDRDGRILQINPHNSGLINREMPGYQDMKGQLLAGQPVIFDMVSSPLVPTPVLPISTPISGKSGEVVGMLTALVDIDLSGIGAFSQIVTVGETGYMEIIDGNGVVIARTSPGLPPREFERSDHPGRFADLIRQDKATVRTCHRCHETENQVKRQRDVLAFAPLSQASWGVAIRQSEDEALAPTRQLGQRFFLLGIIIFIGASLLTWTITQSIVKPIKQLTSATRKVAAGNFKAVIPIRYRDEIGELGSAFYTMTQDLSRARNELLTRNEELSVLNSIMATAGQSLDLEEILENALRKVVELTKSTIGCVFLSNPEGDKLEMKSCVGLIDAFRCQESSSPLAKCACHQVLKNGQTLMVSHASQCPLLDSDGAKQKDIGRFVSVPLKSKHRTLGIMNIAGSEEYLFTEADFKLLDTIGHHVGLAIENSILFEEIKLKEELRGQLLERVIGIQEEERKRLARELHDEYGQTLTGLILNIESLESMVGSQNTQLSDKLKNAKAIAIRALEDLRRMTFDLRPLVLDDLGLIAAIRTYIQGHLEATGIKVDFKNRGIEKRLTPAVETAVFRIIQEATHNVVKHADAHNVGIELEMKNGMIITTVQDDGKGFDVGAFFRSRVSGQSFGLLGMQERATLLGGTFTINSRIGQGTTLVVEIPVGSPQKESNMVKQDWHLRAG